MYMNLEKGTLFRVQSRQDGWEEEKHLELCLHMKLRKASSSHYKKLFWIPDYVYESWLELCFSIWTATAFSTENRSKNPARSSLACYSDLCPCCRLEQSCIMQSIAVAAYQLLVTAKEIIWLLFS